MFAPSLSWQTIACFPFPYKNGWRTKKNRRFRTRESREGDRLAAEPVPAVPKLVKESLHLTVLEQRRHSRLVPGGGERLCEVADARRDR